MKIEYKFAKRFQIDALKKQLNRSEISIILGPRQVGKTYILKQLKQFAKENGKKTKYYNLELPNDLLEFQKTDSELFEMLTNKDHEVVFIDEFHYLPNASKLFKAIYDSHKSTKLFVSGSSSIEIHKHLKESLAGRRLVTQIGPLSFKEFCTAFPDQPIDTLLETYTTYGGLPGLLQADNAQDKIKILQEIVETYIQKDIKSLIKEENIRAFNTLLYLLAQNHGQLTSISSLANEVGLTPKSLERYISIMESTYILHTVSAYSKNLGNELKKSRKFYLYDLGIRNSLLKDFRISDRPDIGAIYESYIYHQLIKDLLPNQEIKFWRTRQGLEIDFIFLENRIPTLIEVKKETKTIPKAFYYFSKRYPETKSGILFTNTLKTTPPQTPLSIILKPFNDPTI